MTTSTERPTFLCSNCRKYKYAPEASKTPSGKPICGTCTDRWERQKKKTEASKATAFRATGKQYIEGYVLPGTVDK